jgi:proline iminopeptidase
MVELYPPIEPYDHGRLDVGDGNLVYWETCGNPEGKPALVLHGGPGTGCSPGMRRPFDPTRYRIVLFDQRGSGRSTPHASDPATDLGGNTTERLLADMERLREHLGIDRWLLHGGSWGSTLVIAYAERYPHRVSEIVLTSISLSRRKEIDWLYHGARRLFPAEWERFSAGAGHADDLVTAYSRLMEDSDQRVRADAVKSWCAWEDAVLSLEPNARPGVEGDDEPSDARYAFVRICAHYYAHAAWLAEDTLLRDAGRLAGIPGVLIHGRLDLSCPVTTAWELARAWPGAELLVDAHSGHRGSPVKRAWTLAALDRFASRR